MTQLTLLEEAETLLLQWREARGANPLPHTSFIDPVKLRRWVGDISVIHVHEGEKRLFVALHGSNVARHLGPDFHQKYLEDAIPETAHEQAFQPYDLSIKTHEPTYSIQRRTLGNRLFKSLERMIMPCFVDDPTEVTRFLVWVAPIESNTARSSSIFVPFDSDEVNWSSEVKPDQSSELYLLSESPAAKKTA